MNPISRELTEALLSVIRARMEEQGLSGRALAEKVGAHHVTFARQLRGDTDLTVDQYDAIAVALGDNGMEDLLESARRKM